MYFTIVGENRIRDGLSSVKNIGLKAIEAIIKERKGKPYTSLSDFTSRVNQGLCSQTAIDSLVKSGAFESIGKSKS